MQRPYSIAYRALCTVPPTSPNCLLDLSISPLSESELPKVKSALQTLGIRPQWLNTRERNQVFFLELRTELTQPAEGETALAEDVARGIWSAIGRFVRIVFIFPYLDIWPGGLEFGEDDYVRIMRQRSGPRIY